MPRCGPCSKPRKPSCPDLTVSSPGRSAPPGVRRPPNGAAVGMAAPPPGRVRARQRRPQRNAIAFGFEIGAHQITAPPAKPKKSRKNETAANMMAMPSPTNASLRTPPPPPPRRCERRYSNTLKTRTTRSGISSTTAASHSRWRRASSSPPSPPWRRPPTGSAGSCARSAGAKPPSRLHTRQRHAGLARPPGLSA